MAFRKTMKAEKIQTVEKDKSEEIRTIVKSAGVTSASQLNDEQRRSLPEN
jgi:hypothetical protein